MPKTAGSSARGANDATATMRRIEMLQIIPWAPRKISTPEVHEKLVRAGYSIDLRSVQRDLSVFSTRFPYTSEQQGTAYYWFWPKDCASLNVRTISPEASLALLLAQKHLNHLLPRSVLDLLAPYFEQSRKGLEGRDPNNFAAWQDKVATISQSLPRCDPVVPPEVQWVVMEALLLDRQIVAQYRARNDSTTRETILHPLGLVSNDGILYLVATAWNYEAPYQYALHRFKAAQITNDRCKRPKEFLLSRYVNEEQQFSYPTGDGTIKLKLEIDESAALPLLERPLSTDQIAKRLPGGNYRIHATIQNSSALRWWLLGLGPKVRVLGPRPLRRMILEDHQAAVARYLEGPRTQQANRRAVLGGRSGAAGNGRSGKESISEAS